LVGVGVGNVGAGIGIGGGIGVGAGVGAGVGVGAGRGEGAGAGIGAGAGAGAGIGAGGAAQETGASKHTANINPIISFFIMQPPISLLSTTEPVLVVESCLEPPVPRKSPIL